MNPILFFLLSLPILTGGDPPKHHSSPKPSEAMWVPLYVDATLTGNGEIDTPLGVDTAVIATKYDLAGIKLGHTSDATSHTLNLGGTLGSLQLIEGAGVKLNTGGAIIDQTVTFEADTALLATQYDLLTAGGGDDWGADSVNTDITLTGDGTPSDPLKVDTSVIATVAYVDANAGGGGTPSAITPSQITSDQDDYNPTGFSTATIVRLSGDNGIRAITSMAAGTAWEEKTLINVGDYPLYFPMDHPDGTAANRFTGHPGDYMLMPGRRVTVIYDDTSDRWRIEPSIYHEGGKVFRYIAYPGSAISGDNQYLTFTTANSGSISTNVTTIGVLPAYTLSTATSTNALAGLHVPKTVNAIGTAGDAHLAVETFITTPTYLSDATNTYQVVVGIRNAPTSADIEENNMVGVRYSHGINSGKWELFSQDNSGGEVTADLGITVQADSAYQIRIELDKAVSEARAYVNGAYAGRVTSGFGSNARRSASIKFAKSAGSTAAILLVHRVSGWGVYP